MPKFLSNRVTRFAGTFLCLAMVVATAKAELITSSFFQQSALPAVDASGNLDFNRMGPATFKTITNTSEGRSYIQARGTTQNDSRRSFRAEDSFLGFFLSNSSGVFQTVSDIYEVSPRGSAYLVARAYQIN